MVSSGLRGLEIVVHSVLHRGAVYVDGYIGAHHRAQHAPYATPRIYHFCKEVTLGVDLLGHPDDALRTRFIAELAALAPVSVHLDAWHSFVSLRRLEPEGIRP